MTIQHFEGTDQYYLDPELKAIVNIALTMEKPLLLTGEAGTGKTQLAIAVADTPSPVRYKRKRLAAIRKRPILRTDRLRTRPTWARPT